MLPSPDVRGKESGKWLWESQDSGRRLRVRDLRVGNRDSLGKNGSARELRAWHGARSGSLDSLGADLGIRERSRTCRGLEKPEIAREFGDFWLKSGRVVTGIPSGFPAISTGFGLGKSWTSWRRGLEFERILERDWLERECSGIAAVSIFRECAPKEAGGPKWGANTGKKLDLAIKLGRMKDPTSKGEESSKKAPAAPSSSGGRRTKEVSHQPQSIYYSAPPVPPPATSQPYDYFAPASAQPSQPRPPVSRAPPPAQQNPTSQGQQAGGTQSRPRKQYSPLPAPRSHIYRQLLAGNQIQPISPGPNFDPLRDEIQGRINSNRLTFNAVRPQNVQANPLSDHRPSSGPSINMISICVSGRDEEAQENPRPFVINYTPEELTVGFTGHVASPAPFVVDIHARESYLDSKVPWTYEGSVGSVEQQFSIMGVTRSGWVYESSAAKDKGKAPAVGDGATPESSPFPPNKCNNYIIGRVMIDYGSALNVCPVTTLKQMNVDFNRVRLSKTAVRAFDGSRREVNGEIDLLIDAGPCSFSITFQVLDIPNAFYLLLGRPWIHSAGAVPSSLHQRLKFIVEEKLITVLLRNNYTPGTGLGARGQGINRPIEVEGYKHRRGLGFRPSCHEIIEARKGNHLHRLAAYYGRLNRGTSENEELDNWTSVPRYSAVIADVLHSNPNPRCFDSNLSREQLGEPQPVYFGEGLPEGSQVPEIKESLHHLEDHQITSVEPTEEINVGIEEEPRTLKIGTALHLTQRTRMIDFLKEYQEVFAWSYADMPGLDPSIVEHFLPLDTCTDPNVDSRRGPHCALLDC
ncbi:hypothetical protein CRG98_026418, partial [Punica granatum]